MNKHEKFEELHSPGVSFSPGLKRTAGFAIPGARSNSRRESNDSNFSCIITMSLACLVCHGMSSPSHSFRSYSVSSSEEENRCGAVVACLTRRVMPAGTANTVGTSKALKALLDFNEAVLFQGILSGTGTLKRLLSGTRRSGVIPVGAVLSQLEYFSQVLDVVYELALPILYIVAVPGWLLAEI
uniref:OSJNBb0008G24.10 protein n=1 Tax=Oryza sativa subsp. japonica TaxID=39947 RepID=Q7F2K0_ORYSJ|nr:OSJNBb0008G24.10 [Oryza sativa Japonica Group]